MSKTIRNALKVQELRKKIICTFMMLVVIRFGCQFPIPGTETTFFADWLAKQTTDVFGFFNTMTGGSLSSMSIFALSVMPYITSSIIIQLLTIAIPKLEELQKDGENGRKKAQEHTRCTMVALALIELNAMATDFGRQGLLLDYNTWNTIIAIVIMTTRSALLMWIGEQVMEKGVGSGISVVLLFNILSSVPSDVRSLHYCFIFGQAVFTAATAILMTALVILAMVVSVTVLNDAERRIPVQYSKKMVDRRTIDGQASSTPLKINIAGVMPAIFASSIMLFPVVISQFFTVDYNSIGDKILVVLNSGSWCKPELPEYSISLVIYIALLIIFIYSYMSTTLNPSEMASNMKEQGGFISGIRPGKPTSDYLNKILNYIIFTSACSLIIIATVPILASGLLNVGRISSSGTSLIIIVGVVLGAIKVVKSQMFVRHYKGFLND